VRERSDLSILAVQGPDARLKTASLLSPAHRATALGIARFSAVAIDTWFLARTGYTGEDGFEIILPNPDAVATWRALIAQGVSPAGLGARDTLRLEAGMCLYGNDLDERHNPLESGLEWTVAFEPEERDFIGRGALTHARAAAGDVLVGLVLEERGVLRSHQAVSASPGPGASGALRRLGEVTSGTFSPTLNRSIALARLCRGAGDRVTVDIRGKQHAARIVKPPFVRNGTVLIDI
jgi:aminomethyltransferase